MRGGTRLAPGLLSLGLVAALFLRPWMHGIPVVATALFWIYVLAEVAFPGIALVWAMRRSRGDRVLLAGQGLSLGLALQAFGHFGARALGVPALGGLAPLAVGAAALALGRRGSGPRRETGAPPVGPFGGPLLALLLLASAMQPLVSQEHLGAPISVDLLFHSGNAGEVRHRWPLENPRIAGMPLKYPVLVYALPAAAAGFCGLPVADALLALCPLLWLPLLALQVFNAGRVLFGDARAGLWGAAIVVLHADPGHLLGLGRGAFNSFLATGLYASPTTVCGFVFFASLALALFEWLADEGRSRPPLASLALLSLASSATKASVLPVVAGGLVAVALWAWRRRPELVGAAASALAVLAIGGAPATLWLSTGEGSYHGMLRFGLAAAMKGSAFARWLAGVTGAGSPGAGPLVAGGFLPWLLGYLGLAGVGFVAWLLGRRPPLSPSHACALGAVATGALLGLSLDAFGLSQLFFLYNGQVLLALYAGAAIVLALGEARKLTLAVLACAALPSLLVLATGPLHVLREDLGVRARVLTEAQEHYAQGLAWLRANAARGSILLADNRSLYLSAFGECRLLYESGLYSPAGDASSDTSPDHAYADRVEAQERLLRQPSREGAEAVLRRFPPGTPVRIVADSVQTRIEDGIEVADVARIPARRLFPGELAELEFANAAMHVYRVTPSPGRGADLPSNRATP